MNQIELPNIVIGFDAGVAYFKFMEGLHLGKTEVTDMFAAADKLADNKPYIIMVDARVYFTASSDGRKAGADKNVTPLVKAVAVLTDNLASELIANFFANFNRPHFKFKVFHNEAKALKWLKDSIQQPNSNT